MTPYVINDIECQLRHSIYSVRVATLTLRERKRRLIQDEITGLALGLFREKGFEATTVDDLALAAGLSRRTFFRYFPTKEAVVAGKWAAMGEGFLHALAERPPTEAPWVALRRALDGVVVHYADAKRRAASYALDEVVDTTPALRAALVARIDVICEEAAAVLADRGLDLLSARSLTGACGAALLAAMRNARDRQAAGIGDDLDGAMAAIAPSAGLTA